MMSSSWICGHHWTIRSRGGYDSNSEENFDDKFDRKAGDMERAVVFTRHYRVHVLSRK